MLLSLLLLLLMLLLLLSFLVSSRYIIATTSVVRGHKTANDSQKKNDEHLDGGFGQKQEFFHRRARRTPYTTPTPLNTLATQKILNFPPAHPGRTRKQMHILEAVIHGQKSPPHKAQAVVIVNMI